MSFVKKVILIAAYPFLKLEDFLREQIKYEELKKNIKNRTKK